MATFTLTTSPLDSFAGIAGQDNFFDFTALTLQSTDSITGVVGGGFTDVMRLTAGGTILAAQFLGVSNIEELGLSAPGNVTLANSLVAGSSNGYFVVRDSAGDDTVDGSGISNGVGIAFFSNGGTDTFKGGNGNDVFWFGAADLTSADTVAGGTGFDRLSFGSAGTVQASAFTNVTAIDALVLNDGGNNVTLTDGLVAGNSVGYFSVTDGAGDDTVDASGITNNTPIAFFASGGADTLKGGNGDDSFSFAAADLTSADTVVGGAGSDKLTLTTAGTVSASAFTNVSGLETVALNDGGNNVTLTDGLVAGAPFFSVFDGAGDDTVDASGITNNTAIAFFASGGADTFRGGNGNDSFSIALADLTSADTIVGGAGSDKLTLTTAGTVSAAAFTNVSGLEALVLNGGGNNVTLTDSLVAGAPFFSVIDGAGDDTVDASGITNNTAIAFFGSGGTDTFKGGNGNDSFSFAVADLTSADTVAGGAGVDRLSFSTAGTVLTSAFTNVSGMEELSLSGAGNNVTLTNALVAGTSIGYFTVYDGAGNDTVDASGVTNNTGIGFFGSGGSDTFTGGNGNDAFAFAVADLTAADTVVGGAGSDRLIFTTAGTVTASAFTNVSGLEALALSAAGNNVTLSNGLVAGSSAGFFTVQGLAGADTVDASLVTTTPVAFFGGGGADTLTGGGGNDAFYLPDSAFAGVNGNGGLDRIVLTTPGQSFDLTANNAKITNTEIVSLSESAAASLTLADTDIPLINAATNLLYVVGEADDSVTAGAGWTVVAANVVNNTVAPGHTFTQYHSTATNSDLFIDSTITPTITAAPTTPTDVDGTANGVFETAANTGASAGITASAFGGTGATVTYAITADSSGTGFTIGSSSGIVTVADGSQIDYETAVGHAYSITVTATSGTATSSQTFSIPVGNVNEAPAGTDKTINPLLDATLQEDGSYTFTAADFGFSDPSDTPANTLLNVKFTTVPLVGEGILTNTNTATTIAAGDFVSVSDINSGFIRFTPAANASGSAEASFTFQVQDNGGTAHNGIDLDQSPNTMTLNVTPVNDAPVNSVPGLQTFAEDNTRTFNAANSNLISISDVDAGTSPVKVALSSTNGTISLSGTTGLSFSVGDGTTDAAMTFTGTISDINTALDGLVFTPTTDYNGAAQITIDTNDQGATGGPAQSDNDSIALNITAVNDAPVNNVPVGQSVNEDTTLTFNAANSNLISISDVDAGAGSLQVTLGVAHGTFSLSGTTGLAFTIGDGTADSAMTFTGTLTNINNALNGLTYTGALNYNNTQGSEALNITTSDQGNTGNGGAQSDSDSVAINVIPVNDNPVAQAFTFNGANSAIGNTSFVLDNGTGASPTDPAGPQKTVSGSLLAGATDVDGPGPLVIVAETKATTHGNVIINSDGDFTYQPNAGYTGNDSFTYTVSDQNPGTAGTGGNTVTISIATPKVWYVNADAATDGDGTSANPFNTLAHFQNDAVAGHNVDSAGDTIFLYNTTTNHYTGGLTLENNETLIGQSQGLTVNGTLLEAATGSNSGTIIEGGVVLGSGDTISGVTLGNTGSGTALSGTNFGTFNVDHTTVNTDNNGMILTNGAFGSGASFTSFSSAGATDVSLTNVTGSVDLGTGTMAGLFAVSGGSVNTTYAGNLSQANNAAMLDVSGGHSGTLTFNTGTLSATNGTGLQFSNADGSYNFNGTTTLNGGNAGIDILAGGDATNGSQGTFTFGSNTSITSPTGTALNIDASNAAVTYNGVITQNNAATAVSVTNEKGTHTVDINGLVTANTTTGTGVNITGNSSGTTVQFDGGLNIDTTSGTGFNATGGGTIRVSATGADESINSTGAIALNLNGMTIGAGGLNFDSTTSGGGTAGVSIDTVTGTGDIVLGSGTLSGHSGAEFDINAGSGNVSYGGTIGNGSGDSVQITNHTAGAVTLSGAINDTNDAGGGIVLTNNTGGTITFSNATQTLNTGAGDAVTFTNTAATGAAVTFSGGNLNIDTTSGKGINATSSTTGAGSLTVTGANNSIASGSGTALTVDHVNIGASNVTFRDISANGATSGIILNTTGSSGHLAVTGGGSVTQGGDSSGGTIQNTTGAGISLTSTTGVTLNNMKIQTTVGDGVDGTGVHSFTFTNGTIDKSGLSNALAATGVPNTSNIGFNSNQAGSTNNVDGTVTITNNILNEALYHGVQIFNRAGTLSDVNISNNSLTSTTSVSTSLGQGIHVVAFGDASGVANITKAEINSNSIHNFPVGVGLEFQAGNSSTTGPGGTAGTPGSGTNIIQIDSNTIAGQDATHRIGSEGMVVSIQGGNAGSRGQGNFEINSNNISNVGGFAISHSVFGDATATSTVNSNIINANQPASSGSGGLGIGTSRTINGSDTPNLQVTINANNIQHTDGNGILLVARDATGTVNAKVTNNTVLVPNGEFEEGIRVDSGNINSVNETLAVQISGNTTTGSFSPSFGLTAPGIGVRKEGTNANVNKFGIVGLSPSPATAAQTEVYIGTQNPGSSLGSAGASHTGNPERADVISGSNFVSAVLSFMLATDGGVAAATSAQAASTGEYHLAQAQLDSVVAAAISQWAAAGASASQLAAMHATVFSVADLSGAIIGEQSPGHITIDTDASGHGWFVDPTPNDNSEFTHAQNAAATDLLTDPSNAAAGHLDLLTAVAHELGHVIQLDDSTAASDAHDLMYIDLVNGERRMPDASDVAQANAVAAAQADEAALPLSARAAAGTPVVTGTSGNDVIDAGHGGNILFGGAGADTFVFGSGIQLNTPAPAPVTHVADYSAAQGDSFDFTALTSAFHGSSTSDALVVRAVEDASGKFAMLQVDHIDPTGLPSAPNWVDIAQLDGAHAGDAVNVLIDNHSLHVAHIHVDLLA